MNKMLICIAAVLTIENSTGLAYNEANNEAHSQQTLQSANNTAQPEDNNIVAEKNNSVEVMIYECLLCGLICNKKARLIHHIHVIHTNRSKHTMIYRCINAICIFQYYQNLSHINVLSCHLHMIYQLQIYNRMRMISTLI